MQVEYLNIDDLVQYGNNAKLHPDSQISKLAGSIVEFGFRNPVLVDSDNVLIAGHGRCLAARQAGLNQVPAIRADDLTPEQVRAYRLADNKLAESGWDQELLVAELGDLLAFDFDVGLLGFSPDEVAPLGGGQEGPETIPPDNHREQYGVLVSCHSEGDQEQTYNALLEQGYECKVVTI